MLIRSASLAFRKIISKKSPFESLLILIIIYLFIEIYYTKSLSRLKSSSTSTINRQQSSLLQTQKDEKLRRNCHSSSHSNSNWFFNESAPLPPSRLPPLIPNLTKIPRIIHQTWKTKTDLPNQFAIWADTCKNLHKAPLWEYRLWDDQDNLSFVEEEFPWFLDIYQGLPFDISRVDAMRYMVLYKIGGFYFDLDFECLKPLDPFLYSAILLSRLSDDPDLEFQEHAVPNSFLASAPGHPLWLFLLQRMAVQFRDGKSVAVESIGGSVFLHDSLMEWMEMQVGIGVPPLQYLHHGRIYGYDWRVKGDEWQRMRPCSAQDDLFDPVLCKKELIPKNAVMMTYFSKLWGNWMMLGKMQTSDFH